MLVKGYNITLKRITADDIELVRQWRNSQLVSQFMEIRQEISKKQQIEWFKKIDSKFHNYFLIIENNIPVGLIYGSEIDWETGITGNGGIFMSDEKYFHTDIPLRASFLTIDFGILLHLHTTYIKVLKENVRAIFFNKQLGYILMDNQENVHNQKYYLEAKNYILSASKFKKIMGFSENEKIECTIHDTQHPAAINMLEIYKNTNIPLTSRLKFIIENAA